jgi:hypothetical protein
VIKKITTANNKAATKARYVSGRSRLPILAVNILNTGNAENNRGCKKRSFLIGLRIADKGRFLSVRFLVMLATGLYQPLGFREKPSLSITQAQIRYLPWQVVRLNLILRSSSCHWRIGAMPEKRATIVSLTFNYRLHRMKITCTGRGESRVIEHRRGKL